METDNIYRIGNASKMSRVKSPAEVMLESAGGILENMKAVLECIKSLDNSFDSMSEIVEFLSSQAEASIGKPEKRVGAEIHNVCEFGVASVLLE